MGGFLSCRLFVGLGLGCLGPGDKRVNVGSLAVILLSFFFFFQLSSSFYVRGFLCSVGAGAFGVDCCLTV